MKTSDRKPKVLAVIFVLALLAVPSVLFADGTDQDLVTNNPTDSGGCENEEGSGSDCPCTDTSNPDPDDGCVQLSVDMGRTRYSALTRGVFLQLKELQATSQLYTPDGFKVLAGYTVKRVSWQKTAAGLPRWVMVVSDGGLLTDFYFEDGASVGLVPAGPESRTRQRLAMVDAMGWATGSDPAYYDFYPGDGSRWRFGAAKNAPDYLCIVEHQTPQGRMETKQDLGLEILRDVAGGLRQVATPARLADFVVIGQDAYELAVYPNDATCLSGGRTVEGYFEVLAGAVPEVVWKFRNPTPGTYGVLEVTREKPGAQPQTWRYEFVEAVNDFVLKYPNGVREDRAERLKTDNGNRMMIRKEKRDASGMIFAKIENIYAKKNYKYLRQTQVRDPGGLNLTTAYGYYEGGVQDGLARSKVGEDGAWTQYEYDDLRRKTTDIRPWLDSPTNAPLTECAVTRYGYNLFAPGDFLAFNDQRPRTEVKEVCGVEVSRTYHAYPTNALGQAQEIEERAAFSAAPYGHASNPRTVKTFYAPSSAVPLAGRLATVTYPGGKTEEYGYGYGTFNAATFAFTPDPDGGAWREIVTTTYGENSGVQALRSARVWDGKGREVLNESYVEDGEAFALIGWKRMSHDRSGNLIETAYSDGRVESATWGANCCGKESETSAEGTIIVYGYNLLKQKISENKKGFAADGSDDITTLYTYDLEGRVLSTSVTNTASGLGYVESRSAFDAVGHLTNSFDRLGNATATAYAPLAVIVSNPNGVTSVAEGYLDGRTKRTLENGVVKQSYAYGAINPEELRWTLSAQGALPDVAPLASIADLQAVVRGLDFPWSFSISDSLGRTVLQGKPGFGGTALVTSNAYDIAGNILSSAQYSIDGNSPVNPVILSKEIYSYSSDDNRVLTALDVNTNGVIDLSGPDRITGASTVYEKDASNLWWQVSRSWVYPEFNSSVAVTTSVRRVCLNGLGARQGEGGVLASHSETLEVRGYLTSSSTIFDRTARKMTRVVTTPTSIQPSIRTKVNGLLTAIVSSTAVTNTYAYDVIGRQTAVIDGRGNFTTTTYNALGQLAFMEDAISNRTTYGYDFLGRRTSITDALTNTIYTIYDVKNRIAAQWGATYPVCYGYDALGRMTEVRSYRDKLGIADVPLAGEGDLTKWLYDNPTGLLTNKLYADGKGPSYVYTCDGKLASRLWARGILTCYAYDMAGSLLGVDYADNTPDIFFTYDRAGNMVSVIDVSGSRTFSYDSDGQALTEAMHFQNGMFTLMESYDTFARSSGYVLSNTVNGTSSLITGMTQSYDALSRVSEVSVAGIPTPFRYGYLTGPDLQQSLAMPNGVTRQTTYDPHRDLVTSTIHTNVAGTVLTHRTFSYDVAGRLTGRNQYRLGDETNRIDAFGYNPRSELTQATLGTNAYAYAFDPIGNRQTADEPDFSATYSANTLNQYTNISYGQTSVFVPSFDLDGNQTLLKTATGIWHVTYNAENRPIIFSNITTIVAMAYDYQGRRTEYNETVDGGVSRYERYLYRGNQQIATFNLANMLGETNVQPQLVCCLAWDCSVSGVNFPLVVMCESNWWTCAYDQVKNVTECFGSFGVLDAAYDYGPFGIINSSIVDESAVITFQHSIGFSSEIGDKTLGLVYYKTRHFNSCDGRWVTRDPLWEEGGVNLYGFVNNRVVNQWDDFGTSFRPMPPGNKIPPGKKTPPDPTNRSNLNTIILQCLSSYGAQTGDMVETILECMKNSLNPVETVKNCVLKALGKDIGASTVCCINDAYKRGKFPKEFGPMEQCRTERCGCLMSGEAGYSCYLKFCQCHERLDPNGTDTWTTDPD